MRTPGLDRAFFSLLAIVCPLVLGGAAWMLVQTAAALRGDARGNLPAVSTSVGIALLAACVAGGALWLLVAALRGRSVSRGA
ncbi:MAG TPA: hypothetical protein VF746_22180 [Longimicrobium sp.]|jgi:hypothetical protein